LPRFAICRASSFAPMAALRQEWALACLRKRSVQTVGLTRQNDPDRVCGRSKRLNLTQEEAGRIIGGGRRAFQKYESGATPPSDAAVGLLEILKRHPEEFETLRSLRTSLPGRAGG